MFIAIAVNKATNEVSEHLEGCEAIALYLTDGLNIISRKIIDTPGYTSKELADFLYNQQVDIVASGSMKQNTIYDLKQVGIDVYIGAEGEITSIVHEIAIAIAKDIHHYEHASIPNDHTNCGCGSHKEEGSCDCDNHKEEGSCGCGSHSKEDSNSNHKKSGCCGSHNKDKNGCGCHS